jgi:hypothetical protein
VTDRSTAKTVTIIGAGIGGIYLVADWASLGSSYGSTISTIRSSLKFEPAVGLMSKARVAGSPPSSARQLIFPQLSMAPM